MIFSSLETSLLFSIVIVVSFLPVFPSWIVSDLPASISGSSIISTSKGTSFSTVTLPSFLEPYSYTALVGSVLSTFVSNLPVSLLKIVVMITFPGVPSWIFLTSPALSSGLCLYSVLLGIGSSLTTGLTPTLTTLLTESFVSSLVTSLPWSLS